MYQNVGTTSSLNENLMPYFLKLKDNVKNGIYNNE